MSFRKDGSQSSRGLGGRNLLGRSEDRHIPFLLPSVQRQRPGSEAQRPGMAQGGAA